MCLTCANRSWPLAIVMASVVIGSISSVLVWRHTRTSMSPCEWEVRQGDRQRAVELCLASYDRTREERDLAWAAKAYLYLGDLDGAAKLATRMLHGPLSGDAHGILSYVAMRRGSLDDARTHVLLARDAHARSGDESGLARDMVSLSQIACRAGDFTAALEAADDALKHAPALNDAHIEVVAYVARADALRRIGDTRGAAATLTRAIERATEPCDKAWTRVKYGMCLAEGGDDGLAMVELTAAAEANQHCASRDIWVQVTINQASLLRWKDPEGALAKLDEVTKTEGNEVTTLLQRGYLAADHGALAEADRYLAQAEELEPPDADWPWEIARARAEFSELRGGWFGNLLAEYHYRRATAMVAALRATARARSAYLVSSHRGPYDDLIALLAREGRWRDVLAVVLELDASDMLRATADERVVRDRASPDLDKPTPRSIATPAPAIDDVLAAWRSRDLVIVIAPSCRQIGPGHEQAFRLQIHDGQVTGEAVGDAGLARGWADDLFADPGDRSAAKMLGRMIVPPGPPDGTLHVLAIGSLGKVPLAALRDADGSLIAGRRPLVRVLSLHASRPEGAGAGPAVVIADPLGDLDRAAAEGSVAARALGSGVQVSGSGAERPATRSQLWAAHDAAVLHIAGHVGVRGRWRALRLADGDIEPAEIVQHGLAPRIAVLAGCGSAAAMDEEGWGSLAAALLEAGTAVVIATDRSVRDDVALAVIRDFYAQPDWRTDPAHALASVQLSLDAREATSSDEVTQARSWAAFSVFGRPPVTGAPAAPRAKRP